VKEADFSLLIPPLIPSLKPSNVSLLTSQAMVLILYDAGVVGIYDATLKSCCLRAIAITAMVTNTVNKPHNCSPLGITADQTAPNFPPRAFP
jgi:hypothetical protein